MVMDCDFTYGFYRKLVGLIRDKGYGFASYHDCDLFEKCVIMRHDVDCSLEDALKIGELEKEMGVKSTYFVLVSSPFYNVLTVECRGMLARLSEMGHEIGLHFDEGSYTREELEGGVEALVLEDKALLERASGKQGGVRCVSMHRPSRRTLEADYSFAGLVNSYSSRFFKGYKYLSDSRRHWREDAVGILESGVLKRIQLVTHPFWYHEKSMGLGETVRKFCLDSKYRCYHHLDQNFTNLSDELRKEDL